MPGVNRKEKGEWCNVWYLLPRDQPRHGKNDCVRRQEQCLERKEKIKKAIEIPSRREVDGGKDHVAFWERSYYRIHNNKGEERREVS